MVDASMFISINGETVRAEMEFGPGPAPRLPGYECGCTREGSRERGWLVTLCAEHRRMKLSDIAR